MPAPDDSGPAKSAALVLGSGGARGAYEVGVARFLFEDLRRKLGRPPRIGIVCGTSAGALNALGLGAYADEPLRGVSFLARRWGDLRLDGMVRPRRLELLRLAGMSFGCVGPSARRRDHAGALDPRPFRKLFAEVNLAGAVAKQIRAGVLDALSFTATEVATGRTTVFLQRGQGVAAPTASEGTVFVHCDDLGPGHALASAAIPFLFAPVRIAGRLYCDGSLRQSVPLSPALHLGADRLVVVSTQHEPAGASPRLGHDREAAAGNPIYLLGKAVNALTLDHVDDDLHRLETLNRLLEAGRRAFGDDFAARLNREVEALGGQPLRPVRAVLVRPSESLGRLAADYVRSRLFHSRIGGAAGKLFAQLCELESELEADLVSYLLFDGPFAVSLMELGYTDARSRAAELASLFE